MEVINNLSDVRKSLAHGAVKAISDRSGLGYYTVLRVLNGDTKNLHFSDVLKATAEYLTENKTKEIEAFKSISMALNAESSEQFAARMINQSEKYGEGSSPIF